MLFVGVLKFNIFLGVSFLKQLSFVFNFDISIFLRSSILFNLVNDAVELYKKFKDNL